MKDFTLAKYRELLTELKQHYQIVTVKDYFTGMTWKPQPVVILRHDVDRRPHNALRMAEIETAMGISSTYYFRKTTFNQHIIEDIHFWGHEIGYHYEVMDKAKGDIGVAHAIFNTELEILRCWVPVKTCAAHGNPLTKYDNRTFFERFDVGQFGLVGEAEKVKCEGYNTDTGRGKEQYNLKDRINAAIHYVSLLDPKYIRNSIYYNIHPERWNDGLAWYRQWLFDWGCNLVKSIIKTGGRNGKFNRT